MAPQTLPIKPSWSPVATFGGYYNKGNNSINFSPSDNNFKSNPKNNHYEKSQVKEETVASSNSHLEHRIDTNIELPNSNDINKNTNNISNIQRSFCPCCDDFFSF